MGWRRRLRRLVGSNVSCGPSFVFDLLKAWCFGGVGGWEGFVWVVGILIANFLCVANRQATEEQSQDCARDGKGQGGDKGQEEIRGSLSLAGVLCILLSYVLLALYRSPDSSGHSSAFGHAVA